MTERRKTTPFPEAVCVTPVSGSDSLFSAVVAWDWCGTPAAHGGYLQSIIFSAARSYFLTHHPNRNQPDPIASHVQFLKRVAPGPITLSVSPVNLGPRVSVIQIDLQSQQPKAGGFKSCVIATVTQGNLAIEKGISLPTHPAVQKGDIPDRDRDCEDFVVSPSTQQIAPVFMKLSGRVVKGGPAGWYSDHLGKSIREIWYTFADGTDFDVLSMGYLTDCFGGAPNNFARDDEDYKSGVVYPTLSMATEIKKDPKGAKWLFMRIEAHEIRNGRFDTNVVVLDEKGELVALSNHVSLVLEKHSEEKLRRIYRL